MTEKRKSDKRKVPKAHTGAFKPGYDPRRYVFNKGVTPFREQLSEALNKESMGAVNLLVDTVNNPDAPLKLRIIASKELLDRSLGTSVNQVVVRTLDPNLHQDVKSLSTEELERLLSQHPAIEVEAEIVVNEIPMYSGADAKESLKQSGIVDNKV